MDINTIFFIKFFVSFGIVLATVLLLKKEMKVANYTAAVAGLFLVSIIWIVDFKNASRIVLLGIEIDKRIELAEITIDRLKKVEESASRTEKQLAQVERKARESAENVKAIILREEMRDWLLIFPNGMKTDHSFGMLMGSTGSLESRLFSVNPDDYVTGTWSWSCGDAAISAFENLIQEYPLLVYSRIARAKCLHDRSDKNWDSGTKEIEKLLEIILSSEPRVPALDQFSEVYRSIGSPMKNSVHTKPIVIKSKNKNKEMLSDAVKTLRIKRPFPNDKLFQSEDSTLEELKKKCFSKLKIFSEIAWDKVIEIDSETENHDLFNLVCKEKWPKKEAKKYEAYSWNANWAAQLVICKCDLSE